MKSYLIAIVCVLEHDVFRYVAYACIYCLLFVTSAKEVMFSSASVCVFVTLYYIKVIKIGLKSKTAKPLNGVSVHGVSVTMRTNERKKEVLSRFGKQQSRS